MDVQQLKLKMEKTKTKLDTMSKDSADEFSILDGAWRILAPYKIEKIVDGYDGLEIFVTGVKGEKPSGIFRFSEYYGYRNFDESDMWKRWDQIGVLKSNIYYSSNSELLAWAKNQSPDQELPDELVNFLFVSIDDVFDVLAFEQPTFRLLEL